MNNSTDFQPLTRNPQNDVNGSLQPNSANLQPVVGGNQSGSLNPQILPQTNSLHVVGTKSIQGVAPGNDTPPPGGISPWVSPITGIFLVGLLIIGARASKSPEELAKAKESKAFKPAGKSAVLKDKIIEPSLLVKQKKKTPKKKNKKRKK